MKNIKMKRVVSLLLSLVMTTGLLAGCGGPQKIWTDDDIINNDETIKLTVFSQTANWSGAQSGWAATYLKDRFNVELTIIPDTDGAYQTRMEKGDLGDIIVWGTNGDVFFSIFDYAGSTLFNTPTHVADNKYMAPLVPTDASVIVYGISTGGNDRIWSIGSKALFPEKCMQIIDWLHTPEGAMTIWYGIKGLMWDYDENGRTYFTDLGETCYFDPTTDLTGTEWTSPFTGETYQLDGTFNDGKIQANNITWGFGAKNPESAEGECFHYSTWESQMGQPKNETDADWGAYNGALGTQDYMNTVNYTMVPTVSTYHEPAREAELELKWNQVKTAVVNGT